MEDEALLRSSRAPSFSLGTRTKVPDVTKSINPQNSNPSPAEYDNNPEATKNLMASHFKKSSFAPTNTKRFDNPGIYECM